MPTRILAILLLPFIISVMGAWIIYKYGYLLNFLDQPNIRSSHFTPMPKGGGIGILVGFIVVSIILSLPIFFWIPAVALSIMGFLSDRHNISISFRLFCQFAASFLFLVGIWKWHPVAYAGYFMLIPLSVFIVGTANYYNFISRPLPPLQ